MKSESKRKDIQAKRESRRKGYGGTQEFFTPDEIVNEMCNMVSEDTWKDPEKDFLEPCFGNGNFLIAIIKKKIESGSTWKQALEHTYGVELMPDNVIECYDRILNLLKSMNIDFDEETAKSIMKKNLVQSDFFSWDFEKWKPKEAPKTLFG